MNAAVATVSSSGLATGVAAGSTTITASLSGFSGSAMLTVQTKSLTSIAVAPANANVAEGGTLQFGATGTYNDGSTANVTATVTWSVDSINGGNSTVGTIAAGVYTAPSSAGTHTIAATSTTNASVTGSVTVTVVSSAQGAVLTYHNDDTRDGAYTQEVTLTPANVNSTQFGKLFSYPVDGQIYAQPLYLPQLSISGGTHDVVYVATQNNSVYAFDATGTQTTPFWQVNLGAPVYKGEQYGVNPYVGILATPVIDPTTNTIYVVAETTGTSGPFYLHALDVTTGHEKSNSPVAISATFNGDTLEPSCYQRMGLALNPVSNSVYVAFGTCSHGWLLAYDKTSLAQTGVFDDTNGGAGGGLWSSGEAPAIDDTTGDVYLITGVDSGDQVWITGSTEVGYNDSFVRLNPTNLSVLDYFSPDDNYTLAVDDADLGAGGNILVPGSTSYPHETIGGGKDGNIFVVNRDNMGGFNDGTNNVIQTVPTGAPVQNDNIFSTPVYWNGSVYYHCNDDVLRAYSWSASSGLLSTAPTSVGSVSYGTHGATASVSANGTLNGIIWDTDNSQYDNTDPTSSGPLVLHAYDASNVATELYNSSQAGTRDTAGLALKFTVPTIAGGRVFVPTANELDVYGLLTQ